jgi:hypothetical protein
MDKPGCSVLLLGPKPEVEYHFNILVCSCLQSSCHCCTFFLEFSMTFCHLQTQKASNETYAAGILQIIQLLGKLYGLVGDNTTYTHTHTYVYMFLLRSEAYVQSNIC